MSRIQSLRALGPMKLVGASPSFVPKCSPLARNISTCLRRRSQNPRLVLPCRQLLPSTFGRGYSSLEDTKLSDKHSEPSLNDSEPSLNDSEPSLKDTEPSLKDAEPLESSEPPLEHLEPSPSYSKPDSHLPAPYTEESDAYSKLPSEDDIYFPPFSDTYGDEFPGRQNHDPTDFRQKHYEPFAPEGFEHLATTLKWSPDGRQGDYGIFWLRDNCQCSQCLHPDTRQRIMETFKIPRDIKIKSIEYNAKGAELLWSDDHRSSYEYQWLQFHANRTAKYKRTRWDLKFREFKPGSYDRTNFRSVNYSDVMCNTKALLEWLEEIYIWGFCFVKGVPINPESTQALLERIAHVRHTHYGGFWDFTADLTYKDTAYTSEALGPHTDNTYFTDPARLQLFHLLSHTDGTGGENLLVDGFNAASIMRNESRHNFKDLISTRMPFHSSGNEDVCIQPQEQFPIFKIHPELKRLFQIRWNNYDRAPKKNWGMREQTRWYEAARHFDNIINRPYMQIWTQLEPGTALIFDNWRMLHGRSAFTGKRRMCGGYINNDDYISRYRLLKYGREQVLKNLGNDFAIKDNPNSIL